MFIPVLGDLYLRRCRLDAVSSISCIEELAWVNLGQIMALGNDHAAVRRVNLCCNVVYDLHQAFGLNLITDYVRAIHTEKHDEFPSRI